MNSSNMILLAILATGLMFILYKIQSILFLKEKLLIEKNVEHESPYTLENHDVRSQSFSEAKRQSYEINLGEARLHSQKISVQSDMTNPEQLNSNQTHSLSSMIQDTAVAGDSLVGSTKIENQIINDADAIVRASAAAAIDAYRFGLEDR